MANKRECGILLPIASLPSDYGIGCFSKEAYEFVDLLEKAGQDYWQILPLGPTGYGDSPYQSFSTFAGNPYFIDPKYLIDKGFISKSECDAFDFGDNPSYVDYEKVYNSRFKLLRKAFDNSNIEKDADFKKFIEDKKFWLDDYALYMAIKVSKNNIPWTDWEDDIKLRKKSAIDKYKKELASDILFYQFQQFLFYTQWYELKAYANSKGIRIIGDIPIYVAFDGADAWANPELFQFDKDLKPIAVAGCPPDAFSDLGQLWGNPLYDWKYHKKTGYDWWIKRLSGAFELYDVLRIDHFRGFDSYYSIPFGDTDAKGGHWEDGPGIELFDVMKEKLGKRDVIAEDLGFLTASVRKLVKKTGYPGMKILEFASYAEAANEYLPHNYDKNCVVYTGTHDNETVKGWYDGLNRRTKKQVRDYFGLSSNASKIIHKEMIRAGLMSVANMAIFPIQDYLGLDNSARINVPSTLGTNWKWRLSKNQFSEETAEVIYELCKLYGRISK